MSAHHAAPWSGHFHPDDDRDMSEQKINVDKYNMAYNWMSFQLVICLCNKKYWAIT